MEKKLIQINNELKIKGFSMIQNNLSENHELLITVRGKENFIVMDMKHYNYLRECELDAALYQNKTDYQYGKTLKLLEIDPNPRLQTA